MATKRHRRRKEAAPDHPITFGRDAFHPRPYQIQGVHTSSGFATLSPSDAEKGNPMGEGGVGLSPTEAERVSNLPP
jgi:hypothetical protein